MAVKDYQMWLGILFHSGAAMPLYAFSLFLPSNIAELGYSSTRAQLLTASVYAAAAELTVTIGFITDRTKYCGLCNIIVGIIIVSWFWVT